MNMGRRWIMTLGLVFGLALMPLSALAEGETPATNATTLTVQTHTSSEAVTQLGVLKGDGQGVTDAYLGKTTTRLQAAILMLRLIGKEQEALDYMGTDTFADAADAGKASQPVLAYLKNNPTYGWGGTGTGNFEPNAAITAQQIYKVMLESLNYRSGTDFAFKDTIVFATEQGIYRAAGASPFTNRDLSTVLAETLQATPKGGMHALLHELVGKNIVTADNGKLLEGLRIDVRQTADGASYLTDGKGMALYLFTKDMADLSSCQGTCLTNWPVAYSDQLIVPDGLDAKDFGAFVRTDGGKQLTYQGWPLYYFNKDAKAGDVNGEGANDVWFLVKHPFYTIGLGTDAKIANYLVDSSGRSLYYFDKDPIGKSVCEGNCLANWPVFHADSIVVPKGLKTEDFGEITRSDGIKQTTFKGYPLYYVAQDTKRGDLKGQAVGDIWFAVNPSTFAGTTAGKDTPAPVVTEKAVVEMKENSFTPTVLTVKAETTIEFINRDDMKHNAVAVDGSFKTELLEKGQSATIKLDTPGTYEYFCEPHKSFMKGTIIVQ
ncbi:cupredoxin domain-containing protein [Cohnella lupini]|uniref:Secreted repeat protein with Y-X4-D motif n=1 Tax=Cohnella lupini TaxID=1294267 RepID=A0A3D9IEQ5_9BACL|nr:cupredoxin domain-containing protein [Cohnella lupini]RED60273.1 secreted repeat protein with Y-X4-D motif [Cohnella lupini]